MADSADGRTTTASGAQYDLTHTARVPAAPAPRESRFADARCSPPCCRWGTTLTATWCSRCWSSCRCRGCTRSRRSCRPRSTCCRRPTWWTLPWTSTRRCTAPTRPTQARCARHACFCRADETLTRWARADLVARRAEVVAKLKELQGAAEKVVAFLTNPALVKTLRNDKAYNLEMLRNEHQARGRCRSSLCGSCFQALGLNRRARGRRAAWHSLAPPHPSDWGGGH